MDDASAFPDAPDDATLRRILRGMRVVAMIGLSPNPVRPSYFVARYLVQRGIRVIPVNPRALGDTILGEKVVAGLAGITAPETVDTIDIFRRSEEAPAIVAQALATLPNLRVVWMQVGVRSPEAAEMARARGLDVVQDRCPKIENQRLFGELRRAGFATGIISSRL